MSNTAPPESLAAGLASDSAVLPPSPDRASDAGERKDPFLMGLGERIRALRAQRGMTRKVLAQATDVSERHLANLEYGVGNASILVLQQVARALDCSFAELLGEATAQSPEWLMLREMLEGHDEATLQRVRTTVGQMLSAGPDHSAESRSGRIALVGLRGAGKSTLGRMLAADLNVPFVELSREIERLAGCGAAEILALYGQGAYRRYERRALEQAVEVYPEAVIATAGGMVADLASFNLLLQCCRTVWLQADPEDHMSRVAARGDMRPMAASSEAMADLKAILASRTPFYAKAEFVIDTSAQPLPETFQILRAEARQALGWPA